MQAFWPRVIHVLGAHALLVTFLAEILWKRQLLLGHDDLWLRQRILANVLLENPPFYKTSTAPVTMCQLSIGHFLFHVGSSLIPTPSLITQNGC